MRNLKNTLVKRAMKTVGSVALFLGALAVVPTSLIHSHQPNCPDELLK